MEANRDPLLQDIQADQDEFIPPGDWGREGPDIARLISNTPLAGAEFHKSIPTSQARARELNAAGTELPFVVLADAMPRAYGRQARSWWTGAGSLSFTLLWRCEPASPQPMPGLLSLSAALAVIDMAVAASGGEFVAGRDLTLHWPNDVFLHGRKLSGILMEGLGDGVFAAGVGINVNNHVIAAPKELQAHISSLRDEVGHALPRELLLIDFLRRFLTLAEMSTNSAGQAEITRRANELCIQIGRQTNVHVGQSMFSGPCLAIDASGGLVIDTNDGQRSFHSGEVTTTELP